jgi:two-component system sensor histidine kinase/response regulator
VLPRQIGFALIKLLNPGSSNKMNLNSVEASRGDILLVDDIPDNLRFLSTLLARQGYEVRKALSGRWAIASAQIEPPDLILLDIKMPQMDGYETCQQLKRDPKTCEVPVIFISALDDVLDKVKAFGVGGADYITKPFQAAEVLARVEHQLNLKHLQRQLTEQNQELTRSNRELEQFTYIVSHDLQQPLQSITGFAKLLALKHQNDLDATDHQYLEGILDAGYRMQHLIQDLLAYSHAGERSQMLEPIDCDRVLEQALANLQIALSERKVDLRYDPMPTVKGNEVQLVQLFQNLISNAIKFAWPETQPQIKISVEQQKNEWIFGVHDKGIGIEPQHLENIFEVFQRIHSTQSYPGNGIGLATCKRIIELHAGRIWVESQLGVGTTFYFALTKVN